MASVNNVSHQPVQGTFAPTHSALRVPIFSDDHNWSTGIFDCCADCSSCWDVLLCTPFQIGYQYGFFERGVRHCNGYQCLQSSWVAPLTCAVAAHELRARTRRQYNIEGNACTDCFCAYMCTYCVLCQNYREISLRGHWSGGLLTCAPYVRYASIPNPGPVMGQPMAATTTTVPMQPPVVQPQPAAAAPPALPAQEGTPLVAPPKRLSGDLEYQQV